MKTLMGILAVVVIAAAPTAALAAKHHGHHHHAKKVAKVQYSSDMAHLLSDMVAGK